MAEQDKDRVVIDLTGLYKGSFKECAVTDCSNIKEFLAKYQKDKSKEYMSSDSVCSREEYFRVLEYAHTIDFKNKGYSVIFECESKDGKKHSFFRDN